MRSMLVWLMVCFGSVFAPASSAAGSCQPAELFATDNTWVITGSDAKATGQLHGDLEPFERQAVVTIAQTGAEVRGSTLVDGVFWSATLQQIAYERARQFHLCVVDEPTLHTAAEAMNRQFHQETALTFEYLPQGAPRADAMLIAVPGIDLARFGDALTADSAARQRLLGGSITTADRTLLLVAANRDLDIARHLVEQAGGSWTAATINYGRRELVQT
ncbi:putative membrane protein [Mycobacterium kansasii 662]|uniref:Membrane protein n=3 Tax=Mycobacterium kansasii TaxID=1768 RepID=U5WWT3_MYCKA|nr:membrane protein [Mycobacterium kansasii ATCC 12478]EUA22107.1 putative membrane protein [Mycobacterium kansasii 662]KEP43739.1 membrane protein [Mycobacterium kansasii]OOK84438.1 putative membrane protein [Mycobacterium kansasii]BCI90923.1 hypothetical protein NIIDMKKI_61290 [Mycobacterium kansasii]